MCFLDREPDEEWMQSLAAEMNLSETAFLFPPAPDEVAEYDPPTWRLRWFTPVVEVALCGHATLASAHYLFTQRKIDAPLIRFLTKSGVLTASRTPDDFIELDFPADDPTPAPAAGRAYWPASGFATRWSSPRHRAAATSWSRWPTRRSWPACNPTRRRCAGSTSAA